MNDNDSPMLDRGGDDPVRRRVLFVDDELHILDGLRNVLRRERHRWDMVFALGGEEALAELAKGEFSVVVSDMRMPGMDGADLLRRVREQHPGIIRMVLSGHADQDSIVRALPVSHQFLAKPCEPDMLKSAIGRACQLQDLLQSPGIRKMVGALDTLPSPPRSYHELTELLAEPDASVRRIAAVVERDPAMGAKVLKLVNSAYFGLPRPAATIEQAVLYLGVELLRMLTLTAGAFATDKIAPEYLNLEALQDHSIATGRLARRFLEDAKKAEAAFATALVHDIGKIVFAIACPEQWRRVNEHARETGQPLEVSERQLGDVTHAELGAYLLGAWGLPITIVEAVAYHHRPNDVSTGDRSVLAAVHAADAFTAEGVSSFEPRGLEQRLDQRFFDDDPELRLELPRWRDVVAEHAEATP